ncbi:GAF domain-containing protein [Alteromonas sp. 5E99-2]|uniref:GAF domain-containing protein n=1 Tax=Alteromonas sp. 5E99-2 TaxID=2817683 RepID=UPI001A98AAD1|nr:GAF domain-containing protein [Alteromonas sp. 5E99-2]MBO1255040.1 GAF domain-containing protein [Alteromonas sp. 5E99-2]
MQNKTNYSLLIKQAEILLETETDQIANMANISALLFNNLENINWAGFYLYKEEQLILGPFQGQPACVRIPMGKGVCGVAAAERTVQRIKDVHEFDGHIACDAQSNSEIVIPLVKNDKLIGVLDIDSPIHDRFDEEDQVALEAIALIVVNSLQ